MNSGNRIATFPRDMFAGTVVFLVAMPLCLGIANASGVEPFAGLLSGIIGGLVVALLSGSLADRVRGAHADVVAAEVGEGVVSSAMQPRPLGSGLTIGIILNLPKQRRAWPSSETLRSNRPCSRANGLAPVVFTSLESATLFCDAPQRLR